MTSGQGNCTFSDNGDCHGRNSSISGRGTELSVPLHLAQNWPSFRGSDGTGVLGTLRKVRPF